MSDESNDKYLKEYDISKNKEIDEIFTDGAIKTGIFNQICDLKQQGNELFKISS